MSPIAFAHSNPIDIVPILDGEFFHAWKNEMLEIFNEYHLNKYITSPCAPLVDPLHPTLDESIDMIINLRTVNLITRGLPRNLIVTYPLLIVLILYEDFLRNDFQSIPCKT